MITAHWRFTFIAMATAAVVCGSIILCNLKADPYGFYGWTASGANGAKPAIYRRVRLAKAYDLRRIKPLAIVLGTSRSHVGLRMTHPGWGVPHEARYNSAFDGATTKEMYAYLLHAQAIRPLRQVVLGLDTWQLNQFPAGSRPDFDPTLLFEPGRPLRNAGVYAADLGVLISVDTTRASFMQAESGNYQQLQWLAADGQRLGARFFREVETNFSAAPGAYFRDVDRKEIGYMLDTGSVQITSQSKFGPDTSQPMLTSLDYVAKIVRFCREQRIDLRIFLTPAHAHQLEILAEMGGWSRLEQGKRYLVQLLADDAARHFAQAFPLYDFSGYSSVTTEPVPSPTERREMKFYWDSSHFKERVGDWVLDRVFAINAEGGTPPPDFGVRLIPANLDAELARGRMDQKVYRQGHSDDVALIESLIDDVKTELTGRGGNS
jgi:hypothetical protein